MSKERVFEIEPLSHVAARVCYSLQTLGELIRYTNSGDLPEAVRVACVESWYSNERALIEFLVLTPPKSAAGARSFLPDWSPSDPSAVPRLKRAYGFASQHVSHFGVPKPAMPLPTFEAEYFRQKAEEVFGVADDFASALVAAGDDLADYGDLLRLGLSEGRRLATGAPGRPSMFAQLTQLPSWLRPHKT